MEAQPKGPAQTIPFPTGRKLSNWIDSFQAYARPIGSPDIFIKWTAISAIAAALERKVWTVTRASRLYPSFFIVLVGPAGVGKSISMAAMRPLLEQLEDHHLGPTDVTGAALIDALVDATRTIVDFSKTPPSTTFNALTVLSSELTTFLPEWDTKFLSLLIDLWDGSPIKEHKRTKDRKNVIAKPILNFLACTTPSSLGTLLPQNAWEGGFMARVIPIFSGEIIIPNPWEVVDLSESVFGHLAQDLKTIGKLTGEIKFSDEAKTFILRWLKTGTEPRPDHPNLLTYVTRRPTHLYKLCMIACAARSDRLVISLEDAQLALDWMVEAETWMPSIFKEMTSGGARRVMEETWHHVYHLWIKHKKPIPEARVVAFIAERTDPHLVARIIEVMERSEALKVVIESNGKCYMPKAKVN